MSTPTISYKNHRFPPHIIAHAVWLYYRFPLSLRLVEEMLLERGIVVSYETIRRWGRKFGAAYAKRLCRKKRKSAKAVTGDVLAKMLATCTTRSLRDSRDRAILMVAFASGGRRRSEIAGLRLEQITVEPPIETEDGPLLPSRAIHLGRTKTSGADHDEVVYLTGRPVEVLDAWIEAARIESGSVFRKVDRWGNVSTRALEPGAVNAIVKQRAEMAGLGVTTRK